MIELHLELSKAEDALRQVATNLCATSILPDGGSLGTRVEIHTPEDVERAAKIEGDVTIDAKTWAIIPLENLIAGRSSSQGKLYAVARTVDEVSLFATTLELGVDGVIFQATTEAEARAALQVAANQTRSESTAAEPQYELEPVKITHMSPAGMGVRVCVDTTHQFSEGAGLLIGSFSSSLCLVQAEVRDEGFVAPRPFRVNAGAIHAYVLGADGRTMYLSEMAAGKTVRAVSQQGIQDIAVGRAKFEKRPHTRLVWEHSDGTSGEAILQTAETVHLVTPEASIAITDIKIGDQILARKFGGARHFGMPVASWMEER